MLHDLSIVAGIRVSGFVPCKFHGNLGRFERRVRELCSLRNKSN